MSLEEDFTQIKSIKGFAKRVDKILESVEAKEQKELSKYFDSIGDYISNRNIKPEHRGYALLVVKEASELARNKSEGRFIQAISQAPRLLQAVYSIATFEDEIDFPDRGSCYFKDKFKERHALEDEKRLGDLGNYLIQLAMEMIYYWKSYYHFKKGYGQGRKTIFDDLYESCEDYTKEQLKMLEQGTGLEFFNNERPKPPEQMKVLKEAKYPLQIERKIYGTKLLRISHQDLRNKLDNAEVKITKLEETVTKLERVNSDLEKENAELKIKVGTLEENIKKFGIDIDALRAAKATLIGQLEHETFAHQATKTQLNQEIANLKDKNKQLNNNLEAVTKFFPLKIQEIDNLKNQLTQATQEKANLDELKTRLESKIAALTNDKTELQTQNGAFKSEIENLKANIKRFEGENKRLNTALEETRTKGSRSDAYAEGLEQSLNRANDELESEKSQNRELRRQISQLKGVVEELRKENEKIGSINHQLQIENKNLKDQISSLSTRPTSDDYGLIIKEKPATETGSNKLNPKQHSLKTTIGETLEIPDESSIPNNVNMHNSGKPRFRGSFDQGDLETHQKVQELLRERIKEKNKMHEMILKYSQNTNDGDYYSNLRPVVLNSHYS